MAGKRLIKLILLICCTALIAGCSTGEKEPESTLSLLRPEEERPDPQPFETAAVYGMVSASDRLTYGLSSAGLLSYTGRTNGRGACYEWRDVVWVETSDRYTLGLDKDGRGLVAGIYQDGESDSSVFGTAAYIAEKTADLEQAKEDLAEVESRKNYALDRFTNVGYACFENDAAIVEAISRVFPVFFFLVAALVCATTMTRMIAEERTQIGTRKALGYSAFAIGGKYLLYAGSAALIGSVGGYLLGTTVIPEIIWKVYQIMYGPIAPLSHVWRPLLFGVSFAAAALWEPSRPIATADRPDELTRYLNAAVPLDDPECLSCVWLPMCGGGCPHRRLYGGGKACLPYRDMPEAYALSLYNKLKQSLKAAGKEKK